MALEPLAQQIFASLLGMWVGQTSLPAEVQRHVECLAQNVWFEARGSGFAEKLAVAQVVMNRVHRGSYAADICSVVWSRAQFSWTEDGLPDRVTLSNRTDRRAWSQTVVAALITWNEALPDLTGGATHYHARSVAPEWRREMRHTGADDSHQFYHRKGEAAPARREVRQRPAAGDPVDQSDLRVEAAARARGFWQSLPVLIAEPVGTHHIELLEGVELAIAGTP